MSDLYKYTFAELEFLLGGRPGWPHGREMLGLNPESTEGIRMAGAASLLVRGLAKVDGADIVVDPAVMMPASVPRQIGPSGIIAGELYRSCVLPLPHILSPAGVNARSQLSFEPT